MSNPKPPCADWSVWLGPEVEGDIDLGVMTGFIRRIPPQFSLDALVLDLAVHRRISRFWFCEDFWPIDDNAVMRLMNVLNVARRLTHVRFCLCYFAGSVISELFYLKPSQRDGLPNVSCYVKMPRIILRPGDHIYIGEAYHDELFQVGTGKSMDVAQYLNDEQVY